MYKVLAIVGEELGRGFALAGVTVNSAHTPDEMLAALRSACASGEYGVIAVEERLLGGLDERSRDEMLERNIPLVVPIPIEMRWTDVEEPRRDDYVARLIRRAVGYHLNIQL